MNKNDIVRKLTSRKLWVTVVGIVVGLAAAFGVTENDYAQIVGVIGSIVSCVVYITGESRVDAAGAMPINLKIEDMSTEETGKEV